MAHALQRATLRLATPLGTPLAGDTLFGHVCWALRDAKGDSELTRCLEGYTQGRPWFVVSDGFPAGYLPKPTLPQHFEPYADVTERKAAKRRRWVAARLAGAELGALLGGAVDDAAAYGDAPFLTVQPHNTLNRLTGTTGEGQFAPYAMPQTFHRAGQLIDVYFAADESRVSPDDMGRLLAVIGTVGFGRDASAGLGKFAVEGVDAIAFAPPPAPNAYWTLAPCAPQGLGFDELQSYWRGLTRFGRHGSATALAGNPFKTPVLLSATGAVFATGGEFRLRTFIGQGIGGEGRLSKAQPATVHHGYAPVLPIKLSSRTP